MDLSLTLTVILLSLSALLAVFFGYMGARPVNPNRGPRMIPWRFLMLLSFTAALLMLVHLLTLLGLKSDPPMRY
jgi:lysylphosphatidylglycerol synthetase-like protein (DUF2156 family)